MSDLDIPILVIDDAKFSSAIIAKVLQGGGFTNVRFTNNPQEALRSMEKRPVQLVIADWLLPAMDGIELSRRIRKIDSGDEHFTYVMLMTSRDDAEPLGAAFDAGADDFLNKANIKTQLLPRVMAAARIAHRQNEMMKSNAQLKRKVNELHTTDLVDTVTGLGNEKFTLERLDATLKQSAARGGTACLLLIGVNNLEVIRNQFEQHSIDEMMSGISAKIRGLVRPLDVVTRPQQDLFAVITLQDSINNCNSKSFRRIFDNLYMHSFRTAQGYIPVVVGISITAADETTGFPSANDYMHFAKAGLKQSFDTGMVYVENFDPTKQLGL
ncbi:MAG: response regulator [Pseudomonadales bacterium]